MTSKERILRTFQRRETDRLPIMDTPWAGTLSRWRREGMPENADWRDFFGVDKAESIGINITPNYEVRVLEETEDYVIFTSQWGVTMKQFKHEDSTPEFLDFTVTTPEKWEEAKKRMTVSRDRVDWEYLKKVYPLWQKEGRWIEAGFWFGFDVTHSWMSGTETILIALIEESEWVKDMIGTYLDMCIAHFQMIWDEGYRFDGIFWPDDMGYRNTAFFSGETYREVVKPFHKKAVEWAHEKGIKARLHSCGDIMKLLPDVVDTGIDALNPLEIKAGMDVVKVKEQYGKKIVLHGGMDASKIGKEELIMPVIDEYVPLLKEGGGYIFATDHSIPNDVSLQTYKKIVERVKSL